MALPENVAKRAEREAEFAARKAETEAALQPILDELQAIGVTASSGNLAERLGASIAGGIPRDKILDILWRGFARVQEFRARNWLATCICSVAERQDWSRLVCAWKAEEEPITAGRLANGLINIARATDVPEISGLVCDTKYGRRRILLLCILERFIANAEARAVLMSHGDDPDLHIAIQEIFKREAKRKRRAAKKTSR